MDSSESQTPGMRKLGAIKRKGLNLQQRELIKTRLLDPDQPLPLVIEPAMADVDLVEWTSNNRDFVEARLLKHGAILFRGFEVESAATFEQFALAISPDLFNENGEHPRASVTGNVYTPVYYPPEKQLLWHNENSFNRTWPMKIWFCCMRPADEGGETPIVDSRKVFNLIAPDIRNRFVEKKVMYQRNYGDGTGLDWQTVFQTTDKSEVERRCKEALVDFTWKEGDRLRTRAVRPAVVKHPGAGELVWFNQAQHWHTSCLDPATRDSMTSLFTEEDLPRACYYGDGSLIEDSVMEEILKVYKKLEVVFPWRKADILMLDNRLTAHGRNPYAGKRSMLVAMGSMSGFENI